MAHECPDCYQACYCDGDDTWMDSGALTCVHECEPQDDEYADDMMDDDEVHSVPVPETGGREK